MSIVERTWKSTAIADAEVVISAGMQGQCIFAEGKNSFAVNVKAVSQLKWDDSALKLKEQVKKAAQKKKSYEFQIFDTSTGYHSTVKLAELAKIKPGEASVAK